MFLDTGAETEIRTFRIEYHRHHAQIGGVTFKCTTQCIDHRRIDDVCLWLRKLKSQNLLIALKPGFQGAVCHVNFLLLQFPG